MCLSCQSAHMSSIAPVCCHYHLLGYIHRERGASSLNCIQLCGAHKSDQIIERNSWHSLSITPSVTLHDVVNCQALLHFAAPYQWNMLCSLSATACSRCSPIIINHTFVTLLSSGGADASAAVLAYEFEALRRLHAACTKLRVPRPVLCGELEKKGTAFIAMEKIKFGQRGRGYLGTNVRFIFVVLTC